MRHYYTIHDHENNRLGFAAFKGSPKSIPEKVIEETEPETSFWEIEHDEDIELIEEKKKSRRWMWITSLAVALVIIITVSIYYCTRSGKSDDKPDYQPYSTDPAHNPSY